MAGRQRWRAGGKGGDEEKCGGRKLVWDLNARGVSSSKLFASREVMGWLPDSKRVRLWKVLQPFCQISFDAFFIHAEDSRSSPPFEL